MGFSNLIDSNLTRAFNLVKDLAIEAVFTLKSGTSFNFGNAETTHTSSTSSTVKAVVMESSKKKASSQNTIERTLMFKSKDLIDVSGYDSVAIAGEVWNVGQTVKNDGRITILSIYREK